MNIVIISYSYTGNNAALAECAAKELPAEHIKVSLPKPMTTGTIIMDMIFSRIPAVNPSPDILRQYDLILFFGPVWMGHVASPLRPYLKYLEHNPKPYCFFSISGGADGGNPKLSGELLKRTGNSPAILLDQHISGLVSSTPQVTRKETSGYRINDSDIKGLTDQIIEKINGRDLLVRFNDRSRMKES